jgi:tetratricopeptide (TPR) repeat protein
MLVGRLSQTAFLGAALFAGFVLAVQPIRAGQSQSSPSRIDVDYPQEGSLFPPDITAPTFLWRDPDSSVTQWRIEVSFADKAFRGKPLQFTSRGEPTPVGEIDPNCKKAGAVDPTPTAEQAKQHSWQPDAETWAAIKRYSVQSPATVTFFGSTEANSRQPLSRGAVRIQTSRDPVGAPIFFRDVPLISVPVGEKGVIMPLPTEAVPLIAWRLRYVNETKSRLMMEGLPTCANCHSFSRDGKTLGLDVDGPQNDKGLYGLIPIKKDTSIKNEYVIRWAKFSEEPSTRRFGFMSQVSPDGQYVITSIENPGTRGKDFYSRFYNGFYKDYGFGQVFFPTRGVLAWYSKATGKLQPLPGADELDFVQAGAFWSPDGKYLVFSRARARDSYVDGQKEAQYANDPNETQIQYDLYRIPFNDGKGGKAEPVLGASDNGFSNNFPKVSPDGKWIVFVKCRNGLLMRPDSQLYIVPFEGGAARPLNSNTSRMNSWHSFSPNGRWLVFSSKSRSLYTQMYLTHIDENGNDSPAILIEHATAANRAVNIPEFANIQPGMFETLDAPATDFYRQVDRASALSRKGNIAEALAEWQKAVQLDPEDPKAHFNLAISLEQTGKTAEAIEEYRKSIDLNPQNDSAYTNLGVAMAGMGKMDDAMALFVRAININDRNAKAEANFGAALLERGRLSEAEQHCRKALEIDPASAEAHNALGWVLARDGRLDEGIDHLKQAVKATPDSTEFQYNLGRLLAAKRSFAEAIPHLEKAVLLSKGLEVYSVDLLASMYSEVGRYSDAVLFEKRAVELSVRSPDPSLQKSLQEKLQRFESLAAGK